MNSHSISVKEKGQNLIKVVPIHSIITNPHQPRRVFCDEALEEMADSIRAVGILHPPIVRKVGDHYELIAGERRFRGAKVAGLQELPVIVRSIEDAVSAKAALIENVQRVDLNPIEIAKALQKLSEQFGYSQGELSNKVGKKRSSVSNYLRLITLPDTIQKSISNGELSMGHAKVLLGILDKNLQLRIFERVIREHLSVRDLERLITKKEIFSKSKTGSGDCYTKDLIRKLEKILGTKVSIQSKEEGGTLSIEYYNLDDLERVCEVIGLDQEDRF